MPFRSVRAFVEVARLLSFSRAAEALGMTQSGVSHHVGTLERYLGQRLFERSGASIVLTDTGRQYFDTVHEAFSTIELSTRQIARRPDAGRLVVRTSLPTFAMTVLIPVLPEFSPEPAISVDLVTSLSAPAGGDEFDVLLTRDLELGDETHWKLADETLVCVAAPSLHSRFERCDVSEWPFIAARSRPDVLSAWANAQGIDASVVRVTATFEHYFLALSAVLSGIGFLVVPRILVHELRCRGLLAQAAFPAVRGPACYTAWVNPRSRRLDAASAFCRWLKARLRVEETR